MARSTTSPLHAFPTSPAASVKGGDGAEGGDEVDTYLDELVARMQDPAANAAVDAALDELARLGGAAMNAPRVRR